MKKTLLVSFIYPGVVKYLKEFTTCIVEQSTSDFDILFFNDGVDGLHEKISNDLTEKFHLRIQNIDGNPSTIRYKALLFLKNSKYNKIVFQDSDDLMSVNRMEGNISYLDSYDLVVNDLSLFYESKDVVVKNIWEERLGSEFEFDFKFVKEKNIVGFGNTAIKRTLLEVDFFMSKNEVLVADWFLFYQLLYKSKVKAIFQSTTCTYYRQHTNNLVGLNELTKASIKRALEVKRNQYISLAEVGYKLDDEIEEVEYLFQKTQQKYNIESKRTFHFWWEETKYIL